MLAGWINRAQKPVITDLHEENCILEAQLRRRRLRRTDTDRRRRAALGHVLGRKRLEEIAAILTPDTLLRWYRRLTTRKFDGSMRRRQSGQPCVAADVERLVVRMAENNPTWGYRRLQGALATFGSCMDAGTSRNIPRRSDLDPAPDDGRPL
jgi:hypothetical protein